MGYSLKLRDARRDTLDHVVTDLFPAGGDVSRGENLINISFYDAVTVPGPSGPRATPTGISTPATGGWADDGDGIGSRAPG